MTETVQISIVVVSYQARNFLPFTLDSVYKAMECIKGELIIVDNDSRDASVSFIRQKYPVARVIENHVNLGFGAAVNQGVAIASGKYVLILNPDVILGQESIKQMLGVYSSLNNPAFLSCQLIDGNGRLLAESARNVPSISGTWRKLIGLNEVARSPSAYYAENTGESVQEIAVLAGACLMIERSKFFAIKGFDERYFLYGEDIDICHSALVNGYKNYLLNNVKVLHLKGESSDRWSFRQRSAFYQAMYLYWHKWHHPSALVKVLFLFATKCLLIFHFLKVILLHLLWPMVDMLICFGSFLVVSFFWANAYYGDPSYFPTDLRAWMALWAALIYPIILGLRSTYTAEEVSLQQWAYNAVWVMLCFFALYGLLPEEWRMSRMTLFITSWVAPLFSLFMRYLFLSSYKGIELYSNNASTTLHTWNFEQAVISRNEPLDQIAEAKQEKWHLVDIAAHGYTALIAFLYRHAPVSFAGVFHPKEGIIWKFSSPKHTSIFMTEAIHSDYQLRQYQFNKRMLDSLIALCVAPLAILCIPWKLGCLFKVLDLIGGRIHLVGITAKASDNIFKQVFRPCIIPVDELGEYSAIDYIRLHDVMLDLRMIVKHHRRIGRYFFENH